MSSKSIFISHAASDGEIADVVVDLLSTAMGIDVVKEVFCTSLEGLQIPPGKDFKRFIHEQIQSPKIVVLLISQNYLASPFCLAEVGASWAMAHRMIPFLIPPITFADMKAVLANVHALRITESSDWNEALQVFKEELRIDPNTNRWERKRDELIKKLGPKLKKQKEPPLVSIDKLKAVESQLGDANEEISELETKVSQQDQLINELKKLKNAKEVAAIELGSLPAAKAFDVLVKAAADALKPLPGIVCDALYYNRKNEEMPYPRPGYSDTEDNWESIRGAIDDGYLYDTDSGLKVDDGSPLVQAASRAVEKLGSFMLENDELSGPYMKENNHQFSLSNRKFWNLHL
jgi:hypothetical protein